MPPASYKFTQVRQFRKDGVVLTVTRRDDTGVHSFAVGKEFQDGGEVKRSSYLSRRHLDTVFELLVEFREWHDRQLDADATKAASGR